MAKVVRSSKFRHVYGQPSKRDQCYENLAVSKSAWDSDFAAANEKFVAVCLEAGGGGSFIVLRHDQTGKVEPDFPRVTGHKGAVLDVAFNPFNSNMVASGSEDCNAMVWLIPEQGLTEPLTTPAVTLSGHGRKVGQVVWHPSAENILFTSSADYTIRIWNVATGKEIKTIAGHVDTIFWMSLNHDGSRLCTTSKDKKIRIFDTHTGELVKEVMGHAGSKSSRCQYLGKSGYILTTGFSKMSERQYILWNANDMTEVKTENLDTSSGVLMTFYDADLGIIYIAGKGDGNIRYFELTPEAPYVHYLSQYSSNEPQRGFGFMTKRGCDVNKCEIARFYKLHPKSLVEPISMIVPRKSDVFQEDLYPPTAGDIPALTAEEWINGANAEPKTINLKDGFVATAKEFVAPVVEQTAQEKAPTNPKEYEQAYHRLTAEIKKLRDELASKDIQIRTLEIELKKHTS